MHVCFFLGEYADVAFAVGLFTVSLCVYALFSECIFYVPVCKRSHAYLADYLRSVSPCEFLVLIHQ